MVKVGVTREQATGAWTVLVVAWAAARTVIVGKVFGSHGTNSVTYFVIDVSSSVPYGVSSARAVFAYLDRSRNYPLWLSAATVTFFIPDLYIVATARHISGTVWVGFALWLTVMTAVAVRTALQAPSDKHSR